ncbi:MAG: DUF4199 family protein [Balneolales bacterium]|nr:DUF4199 family protein [Balneolales bacterium]
MERTQPNPFLNSALIVGMIFALITTAVSLTIGYHMINSEPSGSLFSPATLSSVLICLIVIFAGMFAVRHHVGQFNEPLQLGRGAVIGVTTGVFVAVFSAVFSLIWLLIDPAFNDNFMNAMIANIESISQLPAEQKEAMVDSIYTQFQDQATAIGQIKALAINSVLFGALNTLTGLLGVKLFAPKDESLEI